MMDNVCCLLLSNNDGHRIELMMATEKDDLLFFSSHFERYPLHFERFYSFETISTLKRRFV